MTYVVNQADVEVDRDLILPIWAANLPVGGELARKLCWFYVDGPHGRGDGFLLRASSDRAAVGFAGVGTRVLWYRGRPLRAALFADLAIERAHRSGLAALSLLRAVREHAVQRHDLGYGLPNAKAAPLYPRAGYQTLGERARYVRVLRSARYLERRIRPPIAARALARVVDAGRAAATRVRALRDRQTELTWLDDFGPRFDELWHQARPGELVMCQRTAAFLRWRFGDDASAPPRIAALVDRGTRRLRAYAVVRTQDRVAELADLFGASLADVDALLGKLLPELYDLGYASTSLRFFGTPALPALLRAHGFERRADTRAVVLALGDAAPAGLADPASWYLTDLDEDV